MQVISTFNANEVFSYEIFTRYVTLFAILLLDRKEFKKKILNNFEIVEVLNEDLILKKFLMSIYNA